MNMKKFILETSLLQAGDVICTREDSQETQFNHMINRVILFFNNDCHRVSFKRIATEGRLLRSSSSHLVRKSLSCDYSHVLLYVADSSCIHADAQGVHSVNTQRVMLNSKVDFKVLRHIPAQNLNAESIDNICNYARSKVGTEYSKIDAAKSGISRKTKKKLKIRSRYQFCSRLVAESFVSLQPFHINILTHHRYPQTFYKEERCHHQKYEEFISKHGKTAEYLKRLIAGNMV